MKISDAPKNSFSDGDLRFYVWQGEALPSVTTIRRMAGMPWNLHNWVLGQLIDAAVNNAGGLLKMVERAGEDPLLVKAVKAWLRKQSASERDAAANLGSRVHSVVATGREPTADELPFVLQYRDWLEKSGAKVLLSERQIWNLKLGYAGSFDLLVELRSGEKIVVDVKTGKNTYLDHAIQGVSYALGEFVGADDIKDEQATQWLNDASGVSLLHLRPEGWEWQRLNLTPDLYRAFVGLLTFAKFSHANPTIDTVLLSSKKGSAR